MCKSKSRPKTRDGNLFFEVDSSYPLQRFRLHLSQNAKRASARKDTGLDQSLFSVQLFRLRISIIKVCKGANKGHLGGLDKVFKIRDHHHRIHRQILRPNEGLILILAQS